MTLLYNPWDISKGAKAVYRISIAALFIIAKL
jgi:hypothetical protein